MIIFLLKILFIIIFVVVVATTSIMTIVDNKDIDNPNFWL